MTEDVRGELEALLLGDRFSCLAGRSAWRQGGVTHRHYDVLGGEESARLMARDLAEFVATADWNARTFTSFIATFAQPRGVDELRFEELLWQQLQLLHDYDAQSHRWAEGYSSDPQSKDFAFSVAGHPFFVLGLYENNRRWGRQSPFPILGFNSHQQFDRIKAAGMWDRLADKIRKRDIKLQGGINPNLEEYERFSEARRYSGSPKPVDWQCPFVARGPEQGLGGVRFFLSERHVPAHSLDAGTWAPDSSDCPGGRTGRLRISSIAPGGSGGHSKGNAPGWERG